MADQEIRELNEETAPLRTFLLVVQDPSSPYATEKMLISTLFAAQEANRVYPVNLLDLRIHDNVVASLPSTAATDDLGIIPGTFGTDAIVVQTSDADTTTVTQYAFFAWPVPATYDDGETLTFRTNAGMNTTVSDTTATIDVECYRRAAPSSDICGTAAQTINSLTAANQDFTITPTTVVAGDVLYFRITIAITDGGSGTAVIGEINTIDILADSTN